MQYYSCMGTNFKEYKATCKPNGPGEYPIKMI